MRLDKFLCDQELGSRSQVKDWIRHGLVSVNDTVVKSPDYKISETSDKIVFKDQEIYFQKFFYYMMNKPAGVVSATQDLTTKTVLDLLRKEDRRSDLFPAGRLDKDTEGFLFITNDGALAHNLLSPRKHVDKTYLVTIRKPLSAEEIARLQTGVDIGEEKLTLPAKVEQKNEKQILLTIQEGKFHQVKRMLQAVDNEVLALKRLTFGGLSLDETLLPGSYRALTEKEISILKGE